MQKSIIIILSVVAIVILTIAISVLTNPVRGTEEQIRERTLRITPVGTNIEEVLEIIESNRRWKILNFPRGWVPLSSLPESEIQAFKRERVQMNAIQVVLGRSLFFMTVDVLWEFDEDGYLIDVRVRRYVSI